MEADVLLALWLGSTLSLLDFASFSSGQTCFSNGFKKFFSESISNFFYFLCQPSCFSYTPKCIFNFFFFFFLFFFLFFFFFFFE